MDEQNMDFQTPQATPAASETGEASLPDAGGDGADFDRLIRGQYKAQFDERVRRILDGRLRALRQENARLRRDREERQKNAVAAVGSLAAQASDIRALYPDFDRQQEMRQPLFGQLIGAGIDGRTAYEVVHRQELMQTAMSYAAARAREQMARSIASGGQRIREGGGKSSCVSRSDPSRLSASELADIRARVKNGEKIRF